MKQRHRYRGYRYVVHIEEDEEKLGFDYKVVCKELGPRGYHEGHIRYELTRAIESVVRELERDIDQDLENQGRDNYYPHTIKFFNGEYSAHSKSFQRVSDIHRSHSLRGIIASEIELRCKLKSKKEVEDLMEALQDIYHLIK